MKHTEYTTPEKAYKEMTRSGKKEAERDFLADNEGFEAARLRMLNRIGIKNKSTDAESARERMINR